MGEQLFACDEPECAQHVCKVCACESNGKSDSFFLFISAEGEPYSGVIRYNEKVFVKNASYKITLKPSLE